MSRGGHKRNGESSPEFLSGGGKMAALMRARDWSQSPLGPPESWPDELKSAVAIMLPADVQIVLFWGPDYVALYNDAYAPTIGDKHPDALGRPARENWSELWDDLEPLLAGVRDTGETVSASDRPFYIERHGVPETAYFDISYSPIRDSAGDVGGVLCIVNETTEQVASERWRELQNRILELAIEGLSLEDALDSLIATVEDYSSTGMIGSVLLLDEDGVHLRHGAAPSLPDAYNEAIDGTEIGPAVGSCGTAAFTGEPVHVSDIATDPLWADFRELALSHDLHACWSTPIRSSQGQVLGTFALYYREPREPSPRDLELIDFVTRSAALLLERRRAEQTLLDSEERFRRVFESAAVGMLEIDRDWRILGANEAYTQISGRSRGQLIGTDPLGFTHADDLDRSRRALEEILDGKTDRVSFEKRYIRPDGTSVWVRSNLSRVSRPGGDRFLKIVEDIHDRRVAEEGLREESGRLETLNRTWGAVAAELDQERVVQLVTDAGVELTGADFGAFFYNVLDEQGESYMLYTLSGVPRSAFENFPMPRNTAVFGPTFEGSGVLRSDDITKDPRYGKNEPYKGMPKGHPPVRSYLAVPVISRSGEVMGGLFFGHSAPGRFTKAHEQLMIGVSAQAAVSIDNARLYQAVQSANEGLEQRVDERTVELLRAQEALRHSQKMEAIGQLTGGVAHDFNNLLTVIRSSVDLLRRPDLADEKKRRYLDAIAETADRAAALTGQLLAFARKQPLNPKVFDIAEHVRGMTDILRTTVGSSVRLTLTTDCDFCLVESDPNQLEAAMINLAVNARDAMNGEGELGIAIHAADPTSGPSQGDEPMVEIAITDTGHGIPPEALDRIFEPFFTTKEIGRGTGLGLSQVYGFASQSGGEVRVESEVGEGTTFRLYIPKSSKPATAPAEARPAESGGGGSACILVVEDNREVGEFGAQLLQDLGHSTLWAGDAAAALDHLEGRDDIDLVFTDIVMPGGMDGIDLARTIRDRFPDVPVVLTSGYSDALSQGEGSEFPLLRKPYSVEDLSHAIRTALSNASEKTPA
ncbi:MAG TPA: GAF domain-containing protein [Sphingomicrobium sp.]|nr:GAF domain-containing protein [Sphingomicrobium sp.]